MIANGAQYTGIIPEFLQQIEQKTHCHFAYSLVPKNRQEILFESAQADLLITAVKTERRDRFGIFVPLIQLRATLISVADKHAPILHFKDLFLRSHVRLVVVRGYDYGTGYQKILDALAAQGRLSIEPDPLSVARMIKANPQYMTIMSPTIFSGLLQRELIVADLGGKMRYDMLDELPWMESGIYISKLTLSASEQTLLKSSMDKLAQTDLIWKAYQRYYPVEVLKIGLRPLEFAR
ncbi:MAG: hypothetical protein K2Q33_07335 [Gammaproteobacteria bacterium]|nr:hypothetical protein [Gammaproteobacteria bacterium]